MIKVLVVDDEAIVRKGIVLETDWNSLNCCVVGEAANGEEGLEVIEKCRPDLIICDIKMPKMSGIEMLTNLRERGDNTPVIFLTAYSDFAYAQQAVKLSASDYLLKPFEDGKLEEAVLRICSRIQTSRKSSSEMRNADVLNTGKKDKSKYVLEAINYIAANYSKPDISIKTVADSIGISEGHLSHVFKNETEYTVNVYITRYRIKAAMKLLEDCRYKVYEVAEMVGYRDITYFSATFKKITGLNPSEYQDKVKTV